MNSMNEFLDAVAADLKAKFPGVKSCEVHPGQFDLKELARISSQAPAFRVATYEFSKIDEADGGEVDFDCGLSLAIITTDKKGLPREVAAVNLSEQLTRLLAKGQSFGCAYAFASHSPTARNLYGGELSRLKVQMWEVKWRQTIRLGDPDWQPEGVMPTELYVGESPNIGIGHEDDYVLIDENA